MRWCSVLPCAQSSFKGGRWCDPGMSHSFSGELWLQPPESTTSLAHCGLDGQCCLSPASRGTPPIEKAAAGAFGELLWTCGSKGCHFNVGHVKGSWDQLHDLRHAFWLMLSFHLGQVLCFGPAKDLVGGEAT